MCRWLIQGGFAFAFMEGALATALRNGDWLLLDEVGPSFLHREEGFTTTSLVSQLNVIIKRAVMKDETRRCRLRGLLQRLLKSGSISLNADGPAGSQRMVSAGAPAGEPGTP